MGFVCHENVVWPVEVWHELRNTKHVGAFVSLSSVGSGKDHPLAWCEGEVFALVTVGMVSLVDLHREEVVLRF